MGPSGAFLGILFFSGALGLTTSPARGRLQCYTCSFAKPCDPVLTECQEDEIRGMRSSSGKAACLGPSALCWAAPHTGHSPMLSATSAVSRTCATRQPRSDSQAIPTPPSCSLVPSLPGLHISSSSL
ncbi:lymphocyte antigen 6G6e-like isoform X3 [Alexandromys fortis]|uniref:lymphocyte antigen 6G6e-like isoform X3 n=1 Tax=Alexandromys fortis TaxID=100897 RepID=UPI002152AF01|nr:lymphocyte antigen 6G6e-like isoform X3 [Microtus fortis]